MTGRENFVSKTWTDAGAVGRPLVFFLPRLVLVGALLAGCRFNPSLEYPPCENPSDCPAPCVCANGHCLPPAGAGPEACTTTPTSCQVDSDCMTFCACKDGSCQPREDNAFSSAECDPRRIAPGDPLGTLGLLGIDWGSMPDRNLVVNSNADDASPSTGELTLRAALAKAADLSGKSDQPVRITFDPEIFRQENQEFIHLGTPLALAGRNIFLDGRGSNVWLKPDTLQNDTPFRVSCRTCLVAHLTLYSMPGFGMEVIGAEDLYLMGIEILNCGEGLGRSTGGLLVAGGSRRITIGDGQGQPLVGEPQGCNFQNNTGPGLVIGDMDSPPEDVMVFGMDSSANIDFQTTGVGAGVAVRGKTKNVSIGVPPGLDKKIRAINKFYDNGQFGISLAGEFDRVIVRGNLIVGQPYSVALKNVTGEVKFVHNTLIDPQEAILFCAAIPNRGQALFWAVNNIFYAENPSRNFWDLTGGEVCNGLNVYVDYPFLFNVECNTAGMGGLCDWMNSATKYVNDPAFNDLIWPFPTDPEAANGADPNLALEGILFDTNGPAPNRFNGNGPAFGAIEEP